VYILPTDLKNESHRMLQVLSTENIMKEIEAQVNSKDNNPDYPNKKFTLPKFPHLDEKEFIQLEAGTYSEDL
jgi:hypothetical protein